MKGSLKYLNMFAKTRVILEKILKRYDILPKNEQGSIDYYMTTNIEKPIIIWISKILFTSIPIYLAILFTTGISNPFFSIGYSLFWWIGIEIIKDTKRC